MNIGFHDVTMTLQIIQEVVELLIKKVVQEELHAKFQTITRGQFWISLETILWDQCCERGTMPPM